MDNQHTSQLLIYISEKKQNKTYCCIKIISKKDLYANDAVSVKIFKFPIGAFSKYYAPDERRASPLWPFQLLHLFSLKFSISFLFLENVNHSNYFK